MAVPKQEPTVIASTKAFGKEKEGAFLHKELDHFLNRWSEVLEADHRPQVDVPHSALSEPPGMLNFVRRHKLFPSSERIWHFDFIHN